MDMRQLIAQIDHIENKQILNEDAHYATAPVDNSPRVSKSNNQTSIYEMLIKEFGYDVEESTLTENPHANDPAKSAAWAALSPEDQKWLGGADPTDKFILARAPNKGKSVTTSANTGVGNPGEQAAADADFLKRQQATNAQTAADTANTAADAAASATDMSMGQAGAVNAAASKPAVTKPPGGAAQPAANKSMTPTITAYASRMGLLKNNKPDVAAIKKFQQDNGLKADGIIGPNTAGAILSAQKPNSGGRGAGSPAGQPQGAQAAPAAKPAVAPATKPAGSGASPATPVDPTKLSVSQRMATEPSIIDQGRAKLGLPAGGTSPTKEDIVKSQDDAILERIRTALFR